MDKCPDCGADSLRESNSGEVLQWRCGRWGNGVRTDTCRIRQAVTYLSKFTTPGSCTSNHVIANRALEILTGESREYR